MTKTVVAEGYGGPEVLAIQDIALPQPGPQQVLIDVKAIGTNPVDYKLYSGYMGNDPAALPMPIGMELAGVVAAAWHLLTKTGVGTGDTVLIHGASGGIGLMAVQLAVACGAKVIATAGPSSHDQLRGYGAQPVVYGGQERSDSGVGSGPGLADRVRAIGDVDAALDLVGTDEALDTSVELVADRGRIATIVGFGRAAELGIAALTGADGGQEIRDAARPELIALVKDGKLEVTVDKVFPLDDAAEAHRYLQTGHAHGKVVLVP
jgi:NADPH:quinone reductase-like Zn-dependent oxidoreductase